MHSVASRPRARRAKNFVRVARSHRAGCSAACCRSRCSRQSRAPAAPQEQAWRPPPLAARLLPAMPSSLNARRGRTQRFRKELLQLAAALSTPPARRARTRTAQQRAAPKRRYAVSRRREEQQFGQESTDCWLRQNSAPRGVMPLHGRQHSMTRKPTPADDSKWAAARLEELRSQPASSRERRRRCISRKSASQAQKPSRRCRQRTAARARASRFRRGRARSRQQAPGSAPHGPREVVGRAAVSICHGTGLDAAKQLARARTKTLLLQCTTCWWRTQPRRRRASRANGQRFRFACGQRSDAARPSRCEPDIRAAYRLASAPPVLHAVTSTPPSACAASDAQRSQAHHRGTMFSPVHHASTACRTQRHSRRRYRRQAHACSERAA
jgi:hypothetical protein